MSKQLHRVQLDSTLNQFPEARCDLAHCFDVEAVM
jgi:hypothetical protein